MHALLLSVPPTLQQATADSRLCRRFWTLMGMSGSVSCGVTALFSWVLVHTRFCLCPPRVFSQSCVSSGGSMAGLMATSSKRAYAIPRSAAPRAAAPEAGHCWSVPSQETPKHSSGQSLWGLCVLVWTRFVWALWAYLVGKGIDSKCNFTPLPSCWGFSFALACGVSFFGGIQHSLVNGRSAVTCSFGILAGECLSFYSAILKVTP